MLNATLRHIPFFLALLLFDSMQAQRPGGKPSGRPAIAKVYGKVLDASTKKPAAYATVSFYSSRNDSLITGALVQNNGDFSLDKLPLGPFNLKISFVGYTTLEVPGMITRETIEQDLGNLSIVADRKMLETVEVVGEKSTNVLQVDRRVYNVDKDMSVSGGTAEDVMQNIPGLVVDPDGNVELRGSSPRILIDGRPSFLTLDQIPAEDIDRVEVITNPSVIFDAGTTGGILNVVLKESLKPGYSGQIRASVGTNERYGLQGNIRMKEKKFSANISAGYRKRDRPTTGSTMRIDRIGSEVLSYFDQENEDDGSHNSTNLRGELSYNIDNRNSMTLAYGYRRGEYGHFNTQTSVTSNSFREVTETGTRVNDQLSGYVSQNVRLGFKRKAPRDGKYWTTDISFGHLDRTTDALFQERADSADGSQLIDRFNDQRSFGGTLKDQVNFQFDAVDPYKDNKKLEWGVKSSWESEESLLTVTNTDFFGAATTDTSLTNDYEITDIVNGVYVNWSTALNEKWSAQAGLRFEQTIFIADVVNKQQKFEYRYPDGSDDLLKSLFPALYLSRKWEGDRELQINVSRKIARPHFFQAMPIILFSDSRSYRIGNPTLAPEFATLGEINHLLPFGDGKHNWLSSIYGRMIEDVITDFVYPLPSDQDILITSFTNGNTSWNYGWENTIRYKPTKQIDLTLSGNLQWVDISLSSGGTTLSNSGMNWNGKASLQYRLPKDFSVQVNGRFNGPRILPQGTRKEQYVMDVSVNKNIKRTWSFSLSLRDAFNSRYWGYEYDTPFLYQETERRRDIRHLMFSVTYKFGKADASMFSRRGSNQRQEPGQDNGDNSGD